jgi:hypothetical protein
VWVSVGQCKQMAHDSNAGGELSHRIPGHPPNQALAVRRTHTLRHTLTRTVTGTALLTVFTVRFSTFERNRGVAQRRRSEQQRRGRHRRRVEAQEIGVECAAVDDVHHTAERRQSGECVQQRVQSRAGQSQSVWDVLLL